MKRKRKDSLKPRNGHMAAMKLRKSGAHIKTNGALRKLAKDVFRKQIRDAFAAGGILSLFTSASRRFLLSERKWTGSSVGRAGDS